MRISLPLNRIRPRPRRCRPSRKPRHRQIEASPEEMHRAHLPQKPRPKPPKDLLRQHQHAPEPMRILRVIRPVIPVQIEPDRSPHLHRRRMNLHRNPQRSQTRQILAIEIRHRLRPQMRRQSLPRPQPQMQLMIHKVELDIQHIVAILHRRRPQPPRRDIQRHIPPMVLQRSQRQSRLPHDLRPHMQRIRRSLPLSPRQLRPLRLAPGNSTHSASSNPKNP